MTTNEDRQPPERPTPEYYNKTMVRDTSRRSYNMVQNALDYYYEARHLLTEDEYIAGCRLQAAFDKSGAARVGSPSIDGMPGGGAVDPNKYHPDNPSRREVRRCLNHVAGDTGKALIEGVVLYGHRVTELNIHGYEETREKIRRLREALRDVADFYNKTFTKVENNA